MSPSELSLVEVRGGPRQRGRQQGKGARTQIHHALARYRELIPKAVKLTWEEVQREARKFLPYAEGEFPSLLEELRGIAEGADVAFQEVWTINCYEGLTEVRQQDWGCTCVAVRDDVTADGHVLLAHNEDWSSVDRESVYLVHAKPDIGLDFFGMTYGPLLVNIGFNSAGIGVAINSVYPTDGRVGVPRVIFSRAVLDSQTIGNAIRACVPKLRAGGYNYLLVDRSGELYSVETSAETHAIIYGEEGWLAHSNHYLSAKMQAIEEPAVYSSSHVRLNRASRLLRSQLGQITVESLQTILRDHVNHPDSVCTHEDPNDPPHERAMTIASLIMDVTAGIVWAAPGPPCEGEYVAYKM